MAGLVAGVIIGLIIIGSGANIFMIGKPRKPTKAGEVIIALAINVFMIFGVLYLWLV